MSKKNKKQNNTGVSTGSNYPFDLPAVVDMDTLSYASDEELRDREHHLFNEKETVVRSGYDPHAWEVELAYVQRERMIRETRRVNHERYIKNTPDDFYVVDNEYSGEYSGSPEVN